MARWALISGPKAKERTEQALKLVDELKRVGALVGGFVQIKRIDEDHRKHFDLVDLRSGERAHLAEEAVYAAPGDFVTFCALRFKESAFEQARRWLERDVGEAQVVFVGDISKVEVSGGGHYEATLKALSLPDDKVAVICVRADQLFFVVEKFGLEDNACAVLELPASPEACERFYRDVVAEVTRDKTSAPAV